MGKIKRLVVRPNAKDDADELVHKDSLSRHFRVSKSNVTVSQMSKEGRPLLNHESREVQSRAETTIGSGRESRFAAPSARLGQLRAETSIGRKLLGGAEARNV